MMSSFLAFFGLTSACRGTAASIFCFSSGGTWPVVVIGSIREIAFTRYPSATRTALS